MSRRRRTNKHRRTETSKSGSGRSAHSNAAIGDVTLNHFANAVPRPGDSDGGCSGGSGRMKKESLTVAMKNLTVMKDDNDERPWDERDDDSDLAECDDGDGCGVLRTTRDHKRRRRKVAGRLDMEEEVEGTDYPLDLWFLISEYIRPEDVGRFASLCQATYYITTTTRFWLSMFRRHYQWSADLPDSLTYWNLDHRIRHVRLCVVRALYLMYAPFCARLAAEKPLSADPTQLLRAQCILQWHKKDRTQHKYFFKFANAEHTAGRNERLFRSRGNASAYHNPHSGCWVLEATSMGVCAVPMVMGEYLYHAGLGVSANLCSHCLRLALVPGPHLLPHSPNAPTRRHRVPATEITLDPVSNVRLYPWWHPQYSQVVELQDTDEEKW